MILGVSLVIDELHKGQRLVFRYPESNPFAHSDSLCKDYKDQIDSIYKQYFSISHENFAKLFRPKSSYSNKILELEIEDLHFISYPCPCLDEVVAINNNNIGIGNQTNNSSSIVSSSSFQTLSIDTDHSNNDNKSTQNNISEVLILFNIIITKISRKAMKKIDSNFTYKCQQRQSCYPGTDPIAKIMAVREREDSFYGICSQVIKRVLEAVSSILLQQEKKSKYLTNEVSNIFRIIEYSNKIIANNNINTNSNYIENVNDLTLIIDNLLSNNSIDCNIPLIISNPSTLNSDGEADKQFTNVNISPLPDRRRSSNRNNSDPVEPLFYDAKNLSSTMSTEANMTIGEGWGLHLLNIIMKYSSLANEFRILYHNLVGGHSVCVSFNGQKSVNLILSCKDYKLCDDCNYNIYNGNNIYNNRVMGLLSNDNYQSLTNYNMNKNLNTEGSKLKGINLNIQTMITISDTDDIIYILNYLDNKNSLDSMNINTKTTSKYSTNSRLYTFIQASNPTKSFLEMSLILDEPVEELVSMANYLASLGLAEIRAVIYSHSLYRINESCPVSKESKISIAFDKFIEHRVEENIDKSYSLTFLLSHFTGTRTISDFMELLPNSLQIFTIDIIIFFLRYHLIVIMNKYVMNTLNIPFYSDNKKETFSLTSNKKSVSFSSLDLDENSNNNDDSMNNYVSKSDIPELNLLSEEEKQMFERMYYPYIQNHKVSNKNMYEIMWHSKVNEVDFMHVIDKIPFLKIVTKPSNDY